MTTERDPLRIYDPRYETECGTEVMTVEHYDPKSGELLMEDITLTNFTELENRR